MADMGLQAGAAGACGRVRESTCNGWGLVMIEDASNVVHCIHMHSEMQASGGWDVLCVHMQCRISVRQDSYIQVVNKPAMQH